MITVARHALRESLRRRVFVVVLLLTAAFLGLYTWGTAELFSDVEDLPTGAFGVDGRTVAGAVVLGLSMFVALFLGTVLAVFLTLGAVRGDAERGLLQPLIVRPLGRPAYLGGRFLAAAVVSGGYVAAVFGVCVVITGALGWWADRVVGPAVALAAAAVVITALALLGSVALSSTANGIAVFMVFGAGLTAGILGQIGEALSSGTLETIGSVTAWALPFEALYQDGLRRLTADISGPAGAVVRLGPFGRAESAGPLLWPYVVVYLALVGAAATRLFARRDL